MGCSSSKNSDPTCKLCDIDVETTKPDAATTPSVPTIPPPALSVPVRNVLLNLSGFLKSKAEVNADASSHMPKKFMHRYNSFKLESQMSQMIVAQNGDKRAASSYADLKALADKALPIYNATLRRVVERAGLKPDELAVHKGKKLGLDADKGLYYKKLTTAPIKGEERCTEKVNKEYIPEGGGWYSVVDVVRSSIVVNTENELLAVAEALAAEGKDISLLGQQARAGDYVIIRLKNRYKQPCFNGYQDALYSISISLGNGQWMVCEVQVHLAAVLVHKETSHKYYEFMRSYFSGSSSYEARMALLDKVGGDTNTTPEAIVKAAFAAGNVQKLRALKQLLEALGDVRAVAAVAQRLEQAAATSDGRTRPVKEELQQKVDIGAALRKAGKFTEAQQVLQEAFDRCRTEIGEKDAITLDSIHNLGVVLQAQGKTDEAVALNRRALIGREATLGSTHPDTLKSVNNLAITLRAQGKLDEAMPLYRRALAGKEATLGSTHPDTLRSVNNLANALKEQRKLDEAMPLYQRALAGREATLGSTHPDTLVSVNSLAIALKEQGKLDEAMPLYRRALAGREATLGSTHPDTLFSVSNLAIALKEQGKLDEAMPLYQRALTGREATLGSTHPDTLKSVKNIAIALRAQGKVKEANQIKAKYNIS